MLYPCARIRREGDMTKALTGDPAVIAALNEALRGELTAINQYFLHARMLEDWGFAKRGKAEYEESLEEMRHADRLIQRILLLGGLPNLQDLGKLYIGQNLKELIECDYRLELEGIAHYRKAIGIAEKATDYVTRDLFIDILSDEEKHQDDNRAELELIDKIGIQNFGQSQM
jgi:bacterioferritin